MTLTKLARIANVSVSTASKAFSMSSDISELTREEVFAAARANGCFKKFFNAKYPKYIAAVICPELNSRYYSDFCFSMQKHFGKVNFDVCISSYGFSDAAARDRIEYYEKYADVDVIVLLDSQTEHLPPHETPIINISSRNIENADLNIILDMESPMDEAVKYFINSNIYDIGFIGEKLTHNKLLLFKQAILNNKLSLNEETVYISGERFEKGGYDAAQRLLSSGRLPKALICAYDDMAFGAVKLFNEKGIHIPSDVKIISFDNISTSAYSVPSLSSVEFLGKKAAELTVSSVLDILNGSSAEKNHTLSAKLILRESSEIQ